MNVFLSADIEGITGVVSWAQCEGPSADHFDFDFAREMYTHDVNAAIRGAREAGATRVVVKDGHGGGRNLLVRDLEPDAELISGPPGSALGMMEGIDESFDAAVLVGYHARAGAFGVMSHALVGGLHEFWINGQPAGEIAFSAATAGAFGVPVVAVTSDDQGAREAVETLPGVQTCAVKTALGGFRARLDHPTTTGPRIQETVERGVRLAASIPPFRLEPPVEMRLRFQNAHHAELGELLPFVRRPEPYTLEWKGADFLEAAKMAQIVFALAMQARSLEN